MTGARSRHLADRRHRRVTASHRSPYRPGVLPRPILGPALACLLALAAVVAPLPAHAAKAATSYAATAYGATNGERSERDRVKLRTQDCLQRFAVAQARDMAAAQKMYHQDLGPVLEQCGLDLAGENVAYGYADGGDVVAAWMASDGHRANILRRGYRRMAIAARKGDDGKWYVAQLFGRRA